MKQRKPTTPQEADRRSPPLPNHREVLRRCREEWLGESKFAERLF